MHAPDCHTEGTDSFQCTIAFGKTDFQTLGFDFVSLWLHFSSSSTPTPTSCGDYTKLCTADVAHQKPGRNTWPRRLQTSVPHDYSRSPTSTSTAMCASWSTWMTSCSSANRGGYTHLQGDTNQDVTATQRRLYNRQDSRLPCSIITSKGVHCEISLDDSYTNNILQEANLLKATLAVTPGATAGATTSTTTREEEELYTRLARICPIHALGRKATVA